MADQRANIWKKLPFMYTQFEAILARTCFPCQDTPSVKQPFKLSVEVPKGFVAACSGQKVSVTDVEGGHIYKYEQTIPVQSYLVAFAVGDLERAQVGPRSYVYCEPALVKESVEDLQDTELFLQKGEAICGVPYVWKTYDLLMLPRSFPYGGMENPNLTFMNTCLLTNGRREHADVIAHELTHSWAGNLVTNSTWTDFWINEGFTMYIERLILGEVDGEPFRHLHEYQGLCSLKNNLHYVSLTNKEWTKLRPDLTGTNPDEAFSRVPYEKGCKFLFYLESLVGGRAKMISWLQKYFADFQYQSIDANMVREHFCVFFPEESKKVDWKEWFDGEGEGPWDATPYIDKSLVESVMKGVEIWRNEREPKVDIAEWKPLQKTIFLETLKESPLSHEKLVLLQTTYEFHCSYNCDLCNLWIELVLANPKSLNLIMDPTPDAPQGRLYKFLSYYGRGIYITTLFKTMATLFDNEDCAKWNLKQFAKKVLQDNKNFYHATVQNTVQK
eukprot:Platyproteum_vivax@DN6600_c0_g1_i1.p1